MSSISAALTQTSQEFSQALAAKSKTGDNMDKEDFLMLLVTQFQYQDPLNPMEDQEFVAQMAQFSSLEQLMNLNTSMEGLTSATENQQMVNATSYIGKQVSVSGNTIGKVTAADGTTSISTFRYAFGDDVREGVLSVMDSNGNTVYTEALGGKTAGTTFEFKWNGLNDKGLSAADGTYTVSLAAYNSAGEAVLSDQVVDATVTSVVKTDNTVFIGLDGGQTMELANVRQVSQLTQSPSAQDQNSGNQSKDNPSKDNQTQAPKQTLTTQTSEETAAQSDEAATQSEESGNT
ncbi:MAG: flagellar hook assembly protein FlgD [Desulfovibrio sp.]|nr:flagellar hook assembly protein FlgD [Desulfovibrio sp.]